MISCITFYTEDDDHHIKPINHTPIRCSPSLPDNNKSQPGRLSTSEFISSLNDAIYPLFDPPLKWIIIKTHFCLNIVSFQTKPDIMSKSIFHHCELLIKCLYDFILEKIYSISSYSFPIIFYCRVVVHNSDPVGGVNVDWPQRLTRSLIYEHEDSVSYISTRIHVSYISTRIHVSYIWYPHGYMSHTYPHGYTSHTYPHGYTSHTYIHTDTRCEQHKNYDAAQETWLS